MDKENFCYRIKFEIFHRCSGRPGTYPQCRFFKEGTYFPSQCDDMAMGKCMSFDAQRDFRLSKGEVEDKEK